MLNADAPKVGEGVPQMQGRGGKFLSVAYASSVNSSGGELQLY